MIWKLSTRCVAVPTLVDDCKVCDRAAVYCEFFDHDLRGHVCQECSGYVLIAEGYMERAGIAIPQASILEGGGL